MKIVLVILVVAALGSGGAAYYATHTTAESSAVFRVAPIERGDVCATISATGTLEPEELVDVGAQVAGLIKGFGTDAQGKPIDFNSVVEEGQDLAYIDKTSYEAVRDQARAAVAKAEADLLQYKAKLTQSEQEWKRAENLRPMNAIAETDYDLAKSNFTVAEATVKMGEAVILQSKALLKTAQTNYNYTIIKSPVRGKILNRRVNIGQTVVASLNAPSLFLIAKDLRRMQVWALVNEADIGRIRVDMPVRFTVDAYPGETFRGTVTQIRLNAQMTSNVVVYTVIVTTDNPDEKLLPYLTANVQFEVDQRTGVWVVPNAALRFKPQVAQIAKNANESSDSTSSVPSSGESPKSSDSKTSDAAEKGHFGRLWTADGGQVRPLNVVLGVTDGVVTEISGKCVEEGLRVVVGPGQSVDEAAATTETSNPFVPKFPKRR